LHFYLLGSNSYIFFGFRASFHVTAQEFSVEETSYSLGEGGVCYALFLSALAPKLFHDLLDLRLEAFVYLFFVLAVGPLEVCFGDVLRVWGDEFYALVSVDSHQNWFFRNVVYVIFEVATWDAVCNSALNLDAVEVCLAPTCLEVFESFLASLDKLLSDLVICVWACGVHGVICGIYSHVKGPGKY